VSQVIRADGVVMSDENVKVTCALVDHRSWVRICWRSEPVIGSPDTFDATSVSRYLIDSLGQPVVSLPCCDAHSRVAVVDCAGVSPPRAPSCFPVM